jgi:N4-gp56 family major capsid protein
MITDLLNMETLLPIIAAQWEEMGNNAWRIIDEYIQSVLESDTSIGEILAGTAAKRDALTATDTMDFDLVLKAITFLSAQGQTWEKFKIVMHPNTFRDFCQSSTTNTRLNKLIYEDYKWIKDGYVTSMENFDIYISANVKAFTITSAGWTAFTAYPTYAFRSGAYGVSSLDTLEMIYKPYGSAGTSDPLNQRATIWWKCAYGCAVLNPFFIVRMLSRASTNYEWQVAL